MQDIIYINKLQNKHSKKNCIILYILKRKQQMEQHTGGAEQMQILKYKYEDTGGDLLSFPVLNNVP